jgi:hypothetical protein
MDIKDFPSHPFGIAYYHKPTGKVVYLQNRYSDGSYAAHFQYRESITVKVEDLRLASQMEKQKYYSFNTL